MLAEQLRKSDVEVWAYRLMSNRVYSILKPREAEGPCGKRIADIRTSSAHVPVASHEKTGCAV